VVMVWACELSVEEYLAAGRSVPVPRLSCPDCGRLMRFRSGYARDVRLAGGMGQAMWVRRGHCGRCGRSHGLLPSFVLGRRLDTAPDIGGVIEAVVEGASSIGRAATAAGVPFTTARGWLRRFRSRAAVLAGGLAALAVEVGGEAGIGELPVGAARRVVAALRLVRLSLGLSSVSLWSLGSLVTGGGLLGCASDVPWFSLGDRRFIPPRPS